MNKLDLRKNDKGKKKSVYNFYHLCIGFLVLSFIAMFIFINQHQNNVFSEQTYDIIRKSSSNLNIDPLVDKEYSFNSNIFYTIFLNYFNYTTALNLIMIILFMISILILYNLTKEPLIFLLVLLSPLFLQLFFVSNDYSFSFLFMLICLLMIKNNKYVLASIPLAACLFFNTVFGILLTILMICFTVKNKKNKLLIILYSCLMIIFLTMFSSIPIIFANNYFIEFGSLYGISLSMIILTLFGYKEVKKNFYCLTMIICSILFATIDFVAVALAINIVLLYSLSISIKKLIKENWNNENIKKATIGLIFCILLFSSLSHINYNLSNQISKDEINSLSNLSDKINGTIITLPKYGYVVKFFVKKNIFLDNEIHLIKNGDLKIKELNNVLFSRNIKNTLSILGQRNISYVLIPKDIKENVWKTKDSGILFLIDTHKDNFKEILNDKNIEIYKIQYK